MLEATLQQAAQALAYYLALVVIMRIAGKRLAGQMQTLDLIIPEKQRRAHWDGYERVMQSGVTKYGSDLLRVPALHADGQRRLAVRAVRDAFVLQHEEGLLAMHGGGGEEIAQRFGRILVRAHLDAAHFDLFHFQRRAGRGQQRIDLGDAHGGEFHCCGGGVVGHVTLPCGALCGWAPIGVLYET